MTDRDLSVRGIGTRLQMSAGFFLGTLVEVVEAMLWSLVTGGVVRALLPAGAAGDEGPVAFAAASAAGAAAGILYVAYRFVSKALFGRAVVVPIPDNPNVDWHLTIRSFGIAGGGVVIGVLLLVHGFGGDPRLRVGSSAPFVDATMASLAVCFLYLGAAKLLGRLTGR